MLRDRPSEARMKLLIAVLMLAGLSTPSAAQVWVRLDGQRASTNRALLLEFDLAKRDCAYGASQVSEGVIRCMRFRGYRWMPVAVRARG
jgi:hypothetical protein